MAVGDRAKAHVVPWVHVADQSQGQDHGDQNRLVHQEGQESEVVVGHADQNEVKVRQDQLGRRGHSGPYHMGKEDPTKLGDYGVTDHWSDWVVHSVVKGS